jgi:formate dehydrogenase iron-sulfur subunit
MITPSLVEELLADQQSFTAVEQFSRVHDEHALAPGSRYRNLIPLEAPRPGEQYAFEVELDKCSGCKACVTACHSLNGLDDNETWREVGLLINEPKRRRAVAVPTLQQHVTTACHHCVDPACMNGCPVLAYEKDPVTGIVRHLDDQCIGCQYCVLKCPYDVPKYNSRLGIVRKCDMCSPRLAVGEAPACVQACPSEAIRITKTSTSAVTIEFRERKQPFLSGAPGGEYTLPTTRYLNTNTVTNVPRMVAADSAALRPQPTHWPLVVMLVLSQAAVGVCGAVAVAPANTHLSLLALVLGVSSIVASIFHLGRPMGAWRFFLGLRRSWLSREILAFSLFVPLLAGAWAMQQFFPAWVDIGTLAKGACVFFGVAGVACSMMIYHDTQRQLWRWPRSTAFFFGTTLILAAAAAFTLAPENVWTLGAFALLLAGKLLAEISVLRHNTDRELTTLKKSAIMITGRFKGIAFIRMLCAVSAVGCALMLHVGAFSVPKIFFWLPFAVALAGELLERVLYFRTVDAPKMPGGMPS